MRVKDVATGRLFRFIGKADRYVSNGNGWYDTPGGYAGGPWHDDYDKPQPDVELIPPVTRPEPQHRDELSLDVTNADRVSMILRLAVESYWDNVARKSVAWRDDSAGDKWRVIARILETSANAIDNELGLIDAQARREPTTTDLAREARDHFNASR